MKMFLLFLSFSLCCVTALADDIAGVVRWQDSQPLLLVDKSRLVRLKSVNARLTQDLMRLKGGDFLVGTGTYASDRTSITLDTIDMVGLYQLLGFWYNANLDVYEFQDFNRLNLYATQVLPTTAVAKKVKSLNYTLSPDDNNRWSLFLVDDAAVHIGSLEFVNRLVKLSIIDPKTGQVSETVVLTPLAR